MSYEPVDGFRGLVTSAYIQGKAYRLTIETNSEESGSTIRIITEITLLFFLFLVGGFLILNRFISTKIWKPFRTTLSLLKNYELSSGKHLPLETGGILEFQELNEAIAKLVAGNLATFRMQKEFIENASHELQTPLAIIQSKLDLLLQQKNLSKGHHQLILELNKALGRASKINKNLLLLAKIDNKQFNETELVNIGKEVEDVLIFLSEPIQQKEITVYADLNPRKAVQMNRVLAQILVQNLVFNAYRHTLKGGNIWVELGSNFLSIANSGAERLDEHHLFKRFAKGSSSSGTGLGLALVMQICQYYEWFIDYKFVECQHRFTVQFHPVH